MRKGEVEKSLKRFFKRKVSYSFSLLISFLISGGIVFGEEISVESLQQSKTEILGKIQNEREEIKRKLVENQKLLKKLSVDSRLLLKEADFYAKPLETAYASSILADYKRVHSVGKDWKGSVRSNTHMDNIRERFNKVLSEGEKGEQGTLLGAAQYTNEGQKNGHLSSGWINFEDEYNKNTNIYDYESRLFILPVVKSPVIVEADVPNVSFAVPEAPVVIHVTSPSVASVNIGAITVAPPTVALPSVTLPNLPVQPADITVSVNELNIDIAIETINVIGPGALNMPGLVTPDINITINPLVPPSIIPPSPSISSPSSANAPTFTAYVASGGTWLGYKGINYFDPNIIYAPSSVAGVSTWAETQAYLANGKIRRQVDTNSPLINGVNIEAGDTNAGTSSTGDGRGKVYAYRDSTGGYSGYKNIKSNENFIATNIKYNDGTQVMNGPASYVSSPSITAGTVFDDKEIGQKNNWVVTNTGRGTTPMILKNIDFKIGGENGTPGNDGKQPGDANKVRESGVVLLRNNGVTVFENSSIELMGLTTLSSELQHYSATYATGIEFRNTDIDITGDQNTLFSGQAYPEYEVSGTLDKRTANINWALPQKDSVQGKTGIFGVMNMSIETSKNTYFYMKKWTSTRWTGYNSSRYQMSDGSTAEFSSVANPEGLLVYYPTPGRFRVENSDGTKKGILNFNGSENVGLWLNHYVPDRTRYSYNSGMSSDEAPFVDLGTIYMNADENVGIYLAKSEKRPDDNGIFQGNLVLDYKLGTQLYSKLESDGSITTKDEQLESGNKDGDAKKSSNNVALYVESGQRKELTIANGYFPATTNLKQINSNPYGGIAAGTQIGYTELSDDPIKDLIIEEYKVEFGEYSKNNIAVVAKNGSVVEINPSSKITDGQETESDDNKRAEGTIIAFAEGVWFNPRPAEIKPNDGTPITSGVVTDGTPGQKYVLGYGSEIKLMKALEMGGKNSYAAIANKGGKVNTKDITIHGAGSTGAYADGKYKWDDGLNAIATGVAGAATVAKSLITVDGDIELDHIDGGNTGAGAVSYDGTNTGDGAEVTVTGNLRVNGLGAYASGSTSKVEIQGNNSIINTGSNGALIVLNKGTVNFYGGIINHGTDGQLAFYSSATAGNRGNLVFMGATTVNMSKGVVFYGDSSDFAGSTSGTTSYNGMSNVTINLTDNGVNLGVFKGVTTVWDGGAAYLNDPTNGLKNIPQVKAITDNGYWYDSSLEGGNLSVAANVNRDYTSSTPGLGGIVDGFNNITMEKEKVTLESGYTVSSEKGNGLYLGSNDTATSNENSGYTIYGTVDISNGTDEAIATYTSFGHIKVEDGGKIIVEKGFAAYGVNGSKIENEGKIEITSSDITKSSVGILSLAINTSSSDTYGKNAGKAGLWGEVINNGDIVIGGTGGIGIYAENNQNGGGAKGDIKVTNQGTITVGDEGKGIVVKNGNSSTKGGTITLRDSTGISGNKDISVGKNGIGVYAKNSDLIIDGDYGISIKEGGIALQIEDNTSITTTSLSDELTVEYKGTAGAGNAAMGMAFKGDTVTDTFINNLNLNIVNTGNAGTITGIYGIGAGKIINNANITAKSTGAYGILSDKVDVVNTGNILVGDSGASISGAVGIYTADASITTDGDKVVIQGNGDISSNTHPIGIYAKSSTSLAVNKTVDIAQGSGAMTVNGKNGIGIYIEDTAGGKIILNNDSDIALSDSANETDRKFAMFLSNAKNAANDTDAIIRVGANNIGIYSKNSVFTNSGIIDVTHAGVGTRSIGIHNVSDNGNFEFINNGTINVNGVANIGISAVTTGINTGNISLGSGTISVTATSFADGDIPIGIYAKGNNIIVSSLSNTITVEANSVGIYMEGNNSSKIIGNLTFNISSNSNGKVGIGGYFKGGAFADTGTITVNSTMTALAGADPVRPIGLFYGENSTKNAADIVLAAGSEKAIGIYGVNILSFTNSGNITLNSEGIGGYFSNSNVINTGNITVNAAIGYGAYFKGGVSSSSGTVVAAGNDSVGIIVEGTGAKVTNTGSIISHGNSSIGVYVENGGEFINSGTLDSTVAGSSIGGFAKEGTLTNTGDITSEYMGLFGKDASTINHLGTLTIKSGIGILVDGDNSTANLTGGTITHTGTTNMTGVVGKNTGRINLNGTDINMGNNSVGLILDGGSSVLTAGNILVGSSGTGIYAKNSSIDVQAYSGTITMGSKGIAIYAEDSTLTPGSFNTAYSNGTGDKGVGIYYKGTSSIINSTEVVHSGNHFVSIYADGVTIVNSGNQTVQNEGMGIYVNNNSTLNNTGTLNLSGNDSIGIYLDGNSTVTGIGTITGTSVLSGSKIGVYIKNGDIIGNDTYNFDIDGGIGIYLSNNTIGYNGTINLTGQDSAIGIYIEPIVSGNITANINVSGRDSIGLYLGSSGMTGANITYTGNLNISAISTTARGIGAYLDTGAILKIGAGGDINIGGTDNIGFYVKSGATLDVSGGTITNTVDGIFAYIDGGNLTFNSASPLNMNYTNVIVSGNTGVITNNATISVGNGGLQGDNGATIINSVTGTINGTALNGKAMIGTGLGTTLTNHGNINLTGERSIGMYVENQAEGISTGNISVGDKSAAYYSGNNGRLNISGTASVGENSTLLYAAGGNINYTGTDIVIGDKSIALTLSGASSVNFNGKNISVGKEGTGVFVTNIGNFAGISNLGSLTVGYNGTGIYVDNATAVNSANDINLVEREAVGIFTTENGDLNYSGNMLSTALNTKGMISTGTGNIVNSGNIRLIGDSSIGIYGETGTSITNNAGSTIEIGKGVYIGSNLNSAVGIYGKNTGSIINNGVVRIGSDAVGIYGENTFITNTGNIQNTGGKNTGIYGIGKSVVNIGNIILGDTSNGIFVKNGSIITNIGNINVGNDNSSGIYGAGVTGVQHNGGTITVGTASAGIATETGNINVALGANITAGTESSYIYSVSGNGTSATTLTLSDYSIGMYTKVGTMTNTGIITTGKSSVGTGEVKISVGMATESGSLVNAGTINIPHSHGVGMVANGGGSALNASTGIININGSFAYGMQATKNSTIINDGTIIVNGSSSRGMAATHESTVINNGSIQVNGSRSEGIYVDYGATVENYGNILISNSTGTGIYVGRDGKVLNKGSITMSVAGASDVIYGGGSLVNIGDITINGPKVTIDGVTVTNTGTIKVNGALDLGNISLGGTLGNIGTIDADSFDAGQFIVLPNITQGNNHESYIVQYLKGLTNIPNNGSITAISHSVSFLADLQKDDSDPDLVRIVMVKIPYKKLLTGTEAIEFGKGLDELYAGAINKELDMFDALDLISSKDELGSTFDMELRGNIYANIQQRMLDINEVFDMSYENLKGNKLYARESVKIGAIVKSGESKNKNAGVEDYDFKSLGAILLKEYDHLKYGRSSNWSIGFVQTKFDFDYGSDETVYSLNLGAGFEEFIGERKNVKYLTRGEIGINHHETERKIHLSNGTYKNTGKYWSGTVEWKNKIRYDIPVSSEKIDIGVFGTFNLGYGKYQNFKESGDGVELELKSRDMYIVRPGVGTDIVLKQYTESGKISLIGKATAEYELGKVYDGANKAKIKNTSARYYNLEEPKKVKEIIKIGAELKYETREGHSIGFEVTRQEGSVEAIRYGINMLYRF